MYSPKIREDLIPRVYRAAKAAGIRMTKWVNQAIEQALPEVTNESGQEISERNSRKDEDHERDRT